MKYEIEIIAHIQTEFHTKFGLPRQSGLAESLRGRIVFEKKYRVRDAFRGLEGFDYIWVIWKFSEAVRENWSPTVRPPRLGGNERMGVFATRAPFRPNPIGLSCLKLEGVDYEDSEGPVLLVSGIDMMDGTPIYDIKPYIPYVDARPDARGGFTDDIPKKGFSEIIYEPGWDEKLMSFSNDNRAKHLTEASLQLLKEKLTEILLLDPRPSYQDQPDRIYGFSFDSYEVRFRAENDKAYVISAYRCDCRK